MINIISTLLLLWFTPAHSATRAIAVQESSPATKQLLESLTGKRWNLQEIRFVYDNSVYYYNQKKRDNNTINFDGDYIYFDASGKGEYEQADGKRYHLQWQYNHNTASIVYTIIRFRDSRDLQVTWEKIRITGNSLDYGEYYQHANGLNTLGYGTRISNAGSCEGTFQ